MVAYLYGIGILAGYFLGPFVLFRILKDPDESKISRIILMVWWLGYFPFWIIGSLIYHQQFDELKIGLAIILLVIIIYYVFHSYHKKEFENILIRQLNKIFQRLGILEHENYPALATILFIALMVLTFIGIDLLTSVLTQFVSVLLNYWFYISVIILISFTLFLWLQQKPKVVFKIFFTLLVFIFSYLLLDYRNETEIYLNYESFTVKFFDYYSANRI